MGREPLDTPRTVFLGIAVSPNYKVLERILLIKAVELPAAYCVWASTSQAAFLHGRFVWTDWDVDELLAMKEKFNDAGFLKFGLQGVDPVSPAAFFAMT